MSDDVFVCAGKGAAEVMRRLRVDRDEAQAELAAVRAELDETRLALIVATQALDHLRDGTLREVRRALCCVPDEDVVKAAHRTMEGFDRAVRVASRLADQRDDARAWAVAAMTRAGELGAELTAVREALGCADGGDVLKAARVCAVEAGLWRDMSGGGSAELRVDADCGQVRGLVRL